VSVMGALKGRRTVEPAGCSVVAIGMVSEYRLPPSFVGSWTYTHLICAGADGYVNAVSFSTRSPVASGHCLESGYGGGGAASPVAERPEKSESANCVWD